MEETYKQEDPEDEVEMKEKIHFERRETVKIFAENLLQVLKEFTTQEDLDFQKFLRVSKEKRLSTSVGYPLYEQAQACYTINKLIEKETKVSRKTDYCDGERCSPTNSDIEIKRGKSMYKNNFFKGEKLEYLPYSRLGFLKYPKMDWSSLILKRELKEEIDLNILFPLKNRKLCEKHKLPWRRGVLIAGVPGTGKTQLGRILCNVLDGITIIWVTCKAVHDSSRIRTLFEMARKFAPTLIVMEDLDFFGHDREFITNPIVGELLNQLDGSTPNRGVFVLATTNRPHLLDQALADRPSRFDVKIIFEVPELKERRAMVELFSQGKPIEFQEHIAKSTEKLTGSHIKEVINYATLLALKERSIKVEKSHIIKALKKIREKLTKPEYRMVS